MSIDRSPFERDFEKLVADVARAEAELRKFEGAHTHAFAEAAKMAAAAQREFERWKSFVGTMPTMSPPELYTPPLDFLWPPGRRLPERTIVRPEVTRRIGFRW